MPPVRPAVPRNTCGASERRLGLQDHVVAPLMRISVTPQEERVEYQLLLAGWAAADRAENPAAA